MLKILLKSTKSQHEILKNMRSHNYNNNNLKAVEPITPDRNSFEHAQNQSLVKNHISLHIYLGVKTCSFLLLAKSCAKAFPHETFVGSQTPVYSLSSAQVH